MTGTADTEAEEFAKIYNLDVMVIPTNRPLRRIEEPDTRLPHRDARSTKRSSTTSSRSREADARCWSARSRSRSRSGCSKLLKLPRHQARRAEREVPRAGSRDRRAGGPQGHRHDRHEHGGPRHRHPARRQRRVHGAPADAGRRDRRASCPRARRSSSTTTSSSTSSTSTASTACRAPITSASSTHFKKQTDAEHDEVVALGGLHIIGTERHEARRIDNQLRGRAGRQGDPGSSRFYLSLEDDLMRIFGSDRISGLMQRLGMEEGVPIEHGMVTNAIERAQKQVEAQNFSVRKHLLEYDDVMNKQRESIYSLRREMLEGKIQLDRRRRRRLRAGT